MTPTELDKIRQTIGMNKAQFCDVIGVGYVTAKAWFGGKNPVPGPVQKLSRLVLFLHQRGMLDEALQSIEVRE